ncbi:MAG: UDP-glucose--hexose-1-phosphate uridylyltransferase [Chitinispirillaceae bacterium]|nr:UDP-glucose--hexose-1-phosphate uridylyltransferase [Chitinispirillaceae bacterium]
MSLSGHPHRRYNPLLDEWILVSPHRIRRPWQGKTGKIVKPADTPYDPSCYLCPGNRRAEGAVNPSYTGTFVFENDFSALYPEAPRAALDKRGLLVAKSEKGLCRVICYSPRHDLAMPRLSAGEICGVIDAWIEQYVELGGRREINHVQIFENKGGLMGCSNAHPHGQIWADGEVPVIPAREGGCQRDYYKSKKRCLLCDYLALELKERERVVFENDSFAVLVPFWAVWPYEVLLLPKEHLPCVTAMDGPTRKALAAALKRITARYDNLFLTSFPYSMGIHQQPTDGREHPEWHFHFHFFPPLLRSSTVQKFMVGYELLAMPQRDITAENAAQKLRGLSDVHYLEKLSA